MAESKFTGSVLGLIGVSIAAMLMTVFTLGIGLPWAICYVERWNIEHSKIDGRQIIFCGKGSALLCKCLVWAGLIIVTLGIYLFVLPISYRKWIVSNTHYDFED